MKFTSRLSSFWLDEFEQDNESLTDFGIALSEQEKKSLDLVRLASYRRAIANFVQIVSNKAIPVHFVEKGVSAACMTDKVQMIQISAGLEEKNFDCTVGLALHEGSHVLLSDFPMINKLDIHIPNSLKALGKSKGLDDCQVKDFTMTVLNIIEDRYCDNWVYNVAPGYRGYYTALYDKYFNCKDIDKALLSKTRYRKENLESYTFRLISIFNTKNDLDSLKALRKISETIDLSHISRLSTPTKRLEVALEVVNMVFEAIEFQKGQAGGDQGKDRIKIDGDAGEGQPGGKSGGQQTIVDDDSNSSGNGQESDEDEDGDESDDANDGKDGEDKSGSGKGKDDKKDADGVNEAKLKKALDKINDFLKGNVKKKGMSKKDSQSVKVIEQSGTEYKAVGGGGQDGAEYGAKQIECVVVKNLTRELMESDVFPFSRRDYDGNLVSCNSDTPKAIVDGIRLGKVLGRKLQIRGEARTTKFTRQQFGKIDGRMVNELGFGAESVFSKLHVDQYKKAHLHISIDASGSMHDTQKWNKTMTCVVAICKAADMIQNLDVVVDFRGTARGHSVLPYVVIAYDSKKDAFKKVQQLFPFISPDGGTPEGLCFEAIMDLIPPSNSELDSYFLNFSDGQPCFSGTSTATGERYEYGSRSAKHTADQVNKMRRNGVVVNSYFISSGYDEGAFGAGSSNRDVFKKMYGKDAAFINVKNIMEVSRNMNTKFLEKPVS